MFSHKSSLRKFIKFCPFLLPNDNLSYYFILLPLSLVVIYGNIFHVFVREEAKGKKSYCRGKSLLGFGRNIIILKSNLKLGISCLRIIPHSNNYILYPKRTEKGLSFQHLSSDITFHKRRKILRKFMAFNYNSPICTCLEFQFDVFLVIQTEKKKAFNFERKRTNNNKK